MLVNAVGKPVQAFLHRAMAGNFHMGRYIGQRHKHKGPLMHARVRQHKLSCGTGFLPEQQHIKVNNPRPKALCPVPNSAQGLFKLQQCVKKTVGSPGRATQALHHLIAEVRLLQHVLWLGKIERRGSPKGYPRQRGKAGTCRCQVLSGIAKVGPKAHIRWCHFFCRWCHYFCHSALHASGNASAMLHSGRDRATGIVETHPYLYLCEGAGVKRFSPAGIASGAFPYYHAACPSTTSPPHLPKRLAT